MVPPSPLPAPESIRLRGVRQNNLKGFDLDLPLGRYVVVTGLSGAGKSSLVFDTLHAEGQRRYVETFSAYTRQFLDLLDKPKVDRIENIRPSIAIEQTNTVKTSRSTVGTMTELTDFAKVWFSHVAACYDPATGERVEDDTPQTIWQKSVTAHPGRTAIIAFQVAKPESLTWTEILTNLKGQSYVRVLVPTAAELYPDDYTYRVTEEKLSREMEGAHRPGHFDGVATVVARLFNMVHPDVALFGRKDYQQLQVIKHMAKDLAFAIDIVPGPTVREPDGLAMSSRNQYLSDDERRVAVEIIRNLRTMREQAAQGLPTAGLEQEAVERLTAAGFEVDYVAIRRADLSIPSSGGEPGLLGLIAARLGRTRLIDNLEFDAVDAR